MMLGKLLGLGEKKRERPLVLHVDDHPGVVEIVRAMLEQLGCEVTTALNGMDALKLAEKEKPDLILLDIMMPGMDGFMTLAELKKNSSTKDIPVMMVTAVDLVKNIEKAKEMGAVDYIVKPVMIDRLKAKIETVIPLPKAS
ncbi:MAG: response regulator [Elusimicrobia bacterium]|nr:response regulator [Elusimicrobiota bacterium]